MIVTRDIPYELYLNGRPHELFTLLLIISQNSLKVLRINRAG